MMRAAMLTCFGTWMAALRSAKRAITSNMGESRVQLSEKEWSLLPPHLKALFSVLPNPEREEVLATFPDAPGQLAFVGEKHGKWDSVNCYGDYGARPDTPPRIETDKSAARFFYTAKADKADRLQSKHPTVKPVDLMRWLIRLVTPPGGTVLDCFAGSGTTGMAALAEGFNVILIEREDEYVADIRRRVAHVEGADTPLFVNAAD